MFDLSHYPISIEAKFAIECGSEADEYWEELYNFFFDDVDSKPDYSLWKKVMFECGYYPTDLYEELTTVTRKAFVLSLVVQLFNEDPLLSLLKRK